MLAGDEHHDIVGGVGELRPIGLVAERVDVRLDRGGVGGEVERALGLVDRAERVLIGVERHLGVDDQALPAGDADDDVGALARALVVGVADLGGEVGMFGLRPQLSSTLRNCCSPQRPRALGALRSALTSLAASAETRSVPVLHRLDMPGEQPERVLALGLSTLLDRLLIFLQPLVNRLEQGLQIVARRRLAFLEALVGALEEFLLRRARAIGRRPRRIAFRALPWRRDFGERLERARAPPAPRSARHGARRARDARRAACRSRRACSPRSLDRPRMGIALLAHRVELEPQRLRHPLPRRRPARPEQPADAARRAPARQ